MTNATFLEQNKFGPHTEYIQRTVHQFQAGIQLVKVAQTMDFVFDITLAIYFTVIINTKKIQIIMKKTNFNVDASHPLLMQYLLTITLVITKFFFF